MGMMDSLMTASWSRFRPPTLSDSMMRLMEPFVPSFFRTDHLYVRDIQLKMNPLAELIVAPNIGSYVGGDITAGALVSMIWNRPEMSLFIDLGTNGELVFGNSEFLMSCACSAGPAWGFILSWMSRTYR